MTILTDCQRYWHNNDMYLFSAALPIVPGLGIPPPSHTHTHPPKKKFCIQKLIWDLKKSPGAGRPFQKGLTDVLVVLQVSSSPVWSSCCRRKLCSSSTRSSLLLSWDWQQCSSTITPLLTPIFTALTTKQHWASSCCPKMRQHYGWVWLLSSWLLVLATFSSSISSPCLLQSWSWISWSLCGHWWLSYQWMWGSWLPCFPAWCLDLIQLCAWRWSWNASTTRADMSTCLYVTCIEYMGFSCYWRTRGNGSGFQTCCGCSG